MNGGTATGVVMLTGTKKIHTGKALPDGSVKINELAALYGVGGETIRRD